VNPTPDVSQVGICRQRRQSTKYQPCGGTTGAASGWRSVREASSRGSSAREPAGRQVVSQGGPLTQGSVPGEPPPGPLGPGPRIASVVTDCAEACTAAGAGTALDGVTAAALPTLDAPNAADLPTRSRSCHEQGDVYQPGSGVALACV